MLLDRVVVRLPPIEAELTEGTRDHVAAGLDRGREVEAGRDEHVRVALEARLGVMRPHAGVRGLARADEGARVDVTDEPTAGLLLGLAVALDETEDDPRARRLVGRHVGVVLVQRVVAVLPTAERLVAEVAGRAVGRVGLRGEVEARGREQGRLDRVRRRQRPAQRLLPSARAHDGRHRERGQTRLDRGHGHVGRLSRHRAARIERRRRQGAGDAQPAGTETSGRARPRRRERAADLVQASERATAAASVR